MVIKKRPAGGNKKVFRRTIWTDRTLALSGIGIAIFLLLPWASVQIQAMLNGNVTWLMIAAQRMIEGQSLSLSIYETNPPLSIILYMPYVLFAKLSGIPVEYACFFFTLILIFLSSMLVNAILRHFEFLSPLEQKSILYGYFTSLTIITTIYFMDREHIMMMALVPFILCQYAFNEKIVLPQKIIFPALFFGTIAILVKPHYGLLPAIFILFRLINQKRLSVLKDPDFVFLVLGTLIYLAIIYIFFYDYVKTVLPDVIDLYLSGHDYPMTLRLFKPNFFAYTALFVGEALMEDLDKRKKRFIVFLYLCALLCLVPLLVQMKGFYNHLIPAFGFFILGISLSVISRLQKVSKINLILHLFLPILIIGTAQTAIPPSKDYPKAAEMKQMPVAQFLNQRCLKPCVFFALHGDIETINPTAFYTGYIHGTRFPSYWFLPQLIRQLKAYKNHQPTQLPLKRLLEIKDKYSKIAGEDLDNYKPSILIVGTNIDVLGDGEFFDYVNFFSENAVFRNALAKYKKTDTYSFDRAEYFRGTSMSQSLILHYDVYERIQN